MRSGSAQAEAAYLFVPAWLRMVSLRTPLFEEYDVIRPSGAIGKRCATRGDLLLRNAGFRTTAWPKSGRPEESGSSANIAS